MADRLPTSKERIHSAVHILCAAHPKNLRGVPAAKRNKLVQEIIEAALHALTCNDCMLNSAEVELH